MAGFLDRIKGMFGGNGDQAETTEGDTAGSYVVNVSYTGSSSDAIIPSLQLGGNALTLSGAISAKGSSGFEFTLESPAGLSGGEHSRNEGVATIDHAPEIDVQRVDQRVPAFPGGAHGKPGSGVV